MAVLRFDKELLEQELEMLPPTCRAAFAAACAERLLPAYARFSSETGRGDPETIRRALNRLWEDLSGNIAPVAELRALADECVALVPHEDDEPWVESQPSAEDAVAAVVYALEARAKHSSKDAARVARRAYEALDRFAMRGEPGVIVTAAVEARVLDHHVVQAELARQRRDLDDLRGANDRVIREVSTRLRDRSLVESETFFG